MHDPSSGGLRCLDGARRHPDRRAISDELGHASYADVLGGSASWAHVLLGGASDLHGARVATLLPATRTYVMAQWGTWRAGGVHVPLSVSHPVPELERVVGDAEASILVAHPALEPAARAVAGRAGCRLVLDSTTGLKATGTLPTVNDDRPAMMIYTSGTTGRPKGVVTTHANLRAQIESLRSAWQWSEDDRILLDLPLNHIHGIINVLNSALWSGAHCEMHASFDAARTWERLSSGELTLYMAVPTLYHKLVAAWDSASEPIRERWSTGARTLRLMVSGSSALPVTTLDRWRDVTGHTLLERYGMTEIGMALANPLHGERRAGTVGQPLPGVEVRIVDDAGDPVRPGTPGQIMVRGPGVFREYWRSAEDTSRAFQNGWFATGDCGVLEDRYYRLLGRTSVDIIKTGGYKISALEIEEVLRTHPDISDCAVVGVPDEEWGECVGLVIETPAQEEGRNAPALSTLQTWAKERLAPYKVPRMMRAVARLPRNAMGKVVKPDVRRMFDDRS